MKIYNSSRKKGEGTVTPVFHRINRPKPSSPIPNPPPAPTPAPTLAPPPTPAPRAVRPYRLSDGRGSRHAPPSPPPVTQPLHCGKCARSPPSPLSPPIG